ncbi:MAG: NTP transferase domain-containing protein [Candidatus Bathyarchaeia archaeon]
MKRGLFLTVRTGSTRLPGKALLKLDGETIVEFMIDRLKRARVSQTFVLCTTDQPEDDVLEDIAKQKGILAFRGSSSDILSRQLGAAHTYGLDFFVNVEGDDVFCDPELADRTVQHFNQAGADFIRWSGLPLGASPVGISTRALAKVCELKETNNTETGWGYFFTESGLFKLEIIDEQDPELRHPEMRMTMDYPEDYAFVKEVYKRLSGRDFTLRDIMNLVKSDPTITELNAHLKEQYFREFNQKKAKVSLKKPS